MLREELLDENLSSGQSVGAPLLGVVDVGAREGLDAVAAEAVGDLRHHSVVPREEGGELIGRGDAQIEPLASHVRGEALVEERLVGERATVLGRVELLREMVRLGVRHEGAALTPAEQVEIPVVVVLEAGLMAHRRPEHVGQDDRARLSARGRHLPGEA